MNKKIILTACNQLYYDACLTLIASIHRTSLPIIDIIYIYNLGLNRESIDYLNKLEKVEVKYFEDLKEKYPKIDIEDYYKNPKQFQYRGVLRESTYIGDGDLILWMDCGAILMKSAKEIYDLIENDDIFVVRDINNKNFSWTHPTCINIMKASDDELKDYQIWSGLFGYKRNGKYQKLINDALEFHYIKECVHGHHDYNYGKNRINNTYIKGHRHDQSVYSILVSRYKCPTQDLFKFGEYRTMNYCSNETVIFVHRRRYNNHNGIVYKENMTK
jgi:hypothetical protein